ncbi:hypothetical protein ACGRHY_29155 [Streptomyces sp. HK10]|uniref:hypothetical protein n=1 Tax=Streptomyces sp. HK10 TaxID=3373255 RepID=UPI003747FFAC
MSDRSPMQLRVYDVSPEDAPAVVQAIEDACLDCPWDRGQASPTALALGELYGTDETPLGSAVELAAQLLATAPSAAFVVWQDPHYTANGVYIAHVPGVGTYEAPCDVDGKPQLAVRDLIGHLSGLSASTSASELLRDDPAFATACAVLAAVDALDERTAPNPAVRAAAGRAA